MNIDWEMEPYGEVGVLMNLGGDNTESDILKSLLTSKMTKAEPVNILQGLEPRNQPEEQIVFQIQLGQPIKSEFLPNNDSIVQHIPVTYLTTGNPTFAPASNSPVTYVLSRDVVPEGGYCSVGEDDQKIILLHGVDANEQAKTAYASPEGKYSAKESQTVYCDVKSEGEGWKKAGGRLAKKEDEESSGRKSQSKKKISNAKKTLTKRKNTKGKLKGKSPIGKHKKQLKGSSEGSGEEKEKRNLFELTKLEDNVDQVAERLRIGCECSDTNCFDGLNPSAVFRHRLNIADLTKAEHDMYLMGVIMASIHNLEETSRRKERVRIRSCYAYQGKKVCLTAFLYLQHVTLYQMKILRSHLKTHGVSPRVHGNRGRKPANTFSLDIYRRASSFVQNYVEQHSLRTGTEKAKRTTTTTTTTTAYHLPPECTKRIVHGEYKTFCERLKPSQKVMKYSTFTSFLKKQFPNVKFQKREEKKGAGKGTGEEQTLEKGVQADGRITPRATQNVLEGRETEKRTERVFVGGRPCNVSPEIFVTGQFEERNGDV